MSPLIGILVLALQAQAQAQAQALQPVSAGDLRSMLDGVSIEHVGMTIDDYGEIFHADGAYESHGRVRLEGRYAIRPGVLCRGVTMAAPLASPMRCMRVWQNDRGQLFIGGMEDRDGRNVDEVRFLPRPSAEGR